MSQLSMLRYAFIAALSLGNSDAFAFVHRSVCINNLQKHGLHKLSVHNIEQNAVGPDGLMYPEYVHPHQDAIIPDIPNTQQAAHMAQSPQGAVMYQQTQSYPQVSQPPQGVVMYPPQAQSAPQVFHPPQGTVMYPPQAQIQPQVFQPPQGAVMYPPQPQMQPQMPQPPQGAAMYPPQPQSHAPVSQPPQGTAQDPIAFIQKEISNNPCVFFSKSTCTTCPQAKAAIAQTGAKMVVHNIDQYSGGDLKGALTQITGVKTVPQVFIGGQFFGGLAATVQAAQTGQLATILQNAGAL
mmetsp:Transcript_17921/g.26108  ORF Transcript_17921/g.26108 Transcript_17921/m.26108 type:complete len:294 (-) Transcript_17921:396-1277(-)